MSVLRIVRAGLMTTIQDSGRPELRGVGVPLGGAMDTLSYELANRLVGNADTAAAIEMTLLGDELEFSDYNLIAITGAEMAPVVTGRDAACRRVPQNRPVWIPPGTRIRFQAARRGCRCYLAVAGGIDVPTAMGSRSTYLRAAIGGWHGRTLSNGDELHLIASAREDACFRYRQFLSELPSDVMGFPDWFVRTMLLPDPEESVLRLIPGSHFEALSEASQQDLLNRQFQISSQSDRMGYRLIGQTLGLNQSIELLSEGTAPGTVQLPADGKPVLLMSDSAPTGGYPRIAHVISADLPLAAQLRPAQSVRFVMTSLEEAHDLLRQQRTDLETALVMTSLQARPWRTFSAHE